MMDAEWVVGWCPRGVRLGRQRIVTKDLLSIVGQSTAKEAHRGSWRRLVGASMGAIAAQSWSLRVGILRWARPARVHRRAWPTCRKISSGEASRPVRRTHWWRYAVRPVFSVTQPLNPLRLGRVVPHTAGQLQRHLPTPADSDTGARSFPHHRHSLLHPPHDLRRRQATSHTHRRRLTTACATTAATTATITSRIALDAVVASGRL